MKLQGLSRCFPLLKDAFLTNTHGAWPEAVPPVHFPLKGAHYIYIGCKFRSPVIIGAILFLASSPVVIMKKEIPKLMITEIWKPQMGKLILPDPGIWYYLIGCERAGENPAKDGGSFFSLYKRDTPSAGQVYQNNWTSKIKIKKKLAEKIKYLRTTLSLIDLDKSFKISDQDELCQ